MILSRIFFCVKLSGIISITHPAPLMRHFQLFFCTNPKKKKKFKQWTRNNVSLWSLRSVNFTRVCCNKLMTLKSIYLLTIIQRSVRITAIALIIARYNVIIDQSEHAHLCKHLRSSTKMKYLILYEIFDYLTGKWESWLNCFTK